MIIISGKDCRYKSVFDYDTPLFHTENCRFNFIPFEESEYHNS